MTDRETPAGAVEALAVDDALALNKVAHDLAEANGGVQHDFGLKARTLLDVLGWQLTRSVDVERWQRIETAAWNLMQDHRLHDRTANGRVTDDPCRHPRSWAALRDALGEG